MTKKTTLFIVFLTLLPACGATSVQEATNGWIKVTDNTSRRQMRENAPRYLYAHAHSDGNACEGYSDPKTGKITEHCYRNSPR